MDNMLNNIIPYIIFSVPVVVGALIMSKSSGWPSAAEKKNKGLRALKTSLGGTMFGIGLALLFFYHISPATFWSQWSLLAVIGSIFNCVLPIFVLLTIGAYIQYTAWEKTESLMTRQLDKILKSETERRNKFPNRLSILVVYLIMIIVVFGVSYFLEYILLHLPLRLVLILSSLWVIGVTIGTFMAIRANMRQ